MNKPSLRYEPKNFRELMAARPYLTEDRRFVLLLQEIYANGTVKYEAYMRDSGERTDLWGMLNLWEFFKTNLKVASEQDLSGIPMESYFRQDFSKLPKILDSDG